MSTIEEAKRVLVAQAQSDLVGLWAVAWDIENAGPASTDELMRATLSVVGRAIEEDGLLVGELVDRNGDVAAFVPWGTSVKEVLERIEQAWSALGRTPEPGEIAWIVAPDLLPVTLDKYPMGRGWEPPQR